MNLIHFVKILSFAQVFFEKIKNELSPIGKNIPEEISRVLDYDPRFYIDFGFYKFGVTDAIISLFLSMLIIIVGIFVFIFKIHLRPNKRQSILELLIEALVGLCRNSGLNEKQTKEVLPFVTTVGLLVIISNILSVFKIRPASQNPAFPIFLAMMAIIYIIFMVIKFIGFKGFVHAMLYPRAGLLPFKLLDLCIKPISLSFRLFGNIFGGFILMEFVALIVPLFIPGIFGLWFDLGDGIIQGGVFSYLTIVYIGEFVESAEHYKEEQEEKARLKSLLNRASLVRK